MSDGPQGPENPLSPQELLKMKWLKFNKTMKETMTPEELAETGNFGAEVDLSVRKALGDLDHYGNPLKELVTETYNTNQKGPRFVSDTLHGGLLFVDAAGELVSVKEAKIQTIPKGLPGEGDQFIQSIQSFAPNLPPTYLLARVQQPPMSSISVKRSLRPQEPTGRWWPLVTSVGPWRLNMIRMGKYKTTI